MPGEISRPCRPPDTPEWREVEKAVDDWVDSILGRKKPPPKRKKKEGPEEELPW